MTKLFTNGAHYTAPKDAKEIYLAPIGTKTPTKAEDKIRKDKQ
jgi:hypothetical protein